MGGVFRRTINSDQGAELEKQFTESEIVAAVKSCDGAKSLDLMVLISSSLRNSGRF